MINVLKFAATTTVALRVGLSAHPVAAQNTIKLWNIHPDGYPVTEALKSFVDDVRRVTDGHVVINVVSNDALGDQPQAIQMMKSSKLDMAEFNLAALSESVPSMKAVNLPFLFTDSTHMFRLLDGVMGDGFKNGWLRAATSYSAGMTAARGRSIALPERSPARVISRDCAFVCKTPRRSSKWSS